MGQIAKTVRRGSRSYAAFLLGLFICFFAASTPVGAQDTACARDVLQAVVHASSLSLGELLKNVSGDKERAALIRRLVRPVRFFPDASGYIYVYTLEGGVIGHGGMPKLEGENLIDHRDARGFYDVRKAAATARTGGGFFEHYWEKPGQKGEFRKVTYVERVPGTNYFIGAGAYIP